MNRGLLHRHTRYSRNYYQRKRGIALSYCCWLAASRCAAASASAAAAAAASTSFSSSSVRTAFVAPTFTFTKSLLPWSRQSMRSSFLSSSAGSADDDGSSSPSPASPSKFRAALCQFLVGDDRDTNLRRAQEHVEQAKLQHGAELVVLPEIWNSPYATTAFPEYAELLPDVGDSFERLDTKLQPSSHLLGSLAHKHQLWLVGGSIPERVTTDTAAPSPPAPRYYNTCLVFNPDGRVVAKHRKVHLFDIDVPGKIRFMESDTLTGGSCITSFSSPWCEIGIGICYDIRFAEYSQVLAKRRGAKVLIFPGAFNLTTGPLHWELLQRGRAVDNQCWVLTASPARRSTASSEGDGEKGSGKYPPYFAWGHSSAVDPWGTVVATTDEREAIVVAEIDLSAVEDVRGAIPVLKQLRADLYTTSAEKPVA